MKFIFDWLLDQFKLILGFLMEVTYELINSSINESIMFRFILIILSSFALVSFFLGMVVAIIKYATKESQSLNEFIKGILFAGIFAISFQSISQGIYKSGSFMTQQFMNIFSQAQSVVLQNGNLFSVERLVATQVFGEFALVLQVIVIIAMVVMMGIILIQQIKRAVDFLIFQIQGVLCIFSLATGNNAAFSTYIKGVFGLSITQAIQVMFLYAGLISMNDSTFGVFLGFGFFAGAMGVGKRMQDWAYSSGTNSAMQTVMRTGTTIVQQQRMMNMMKVIK